VVIFGLYILGVNTVFFILLLLWYLQATAWFRIAVFDQFFTAARPLVYIPVDYLD